MNKQEIINTYINSDDEINFTAKSEAGEEIYVERSYDHGTLITQAWNSKDEYLGVLTIRRI